MDKTIVGAGLGFVGDLALSHVNQQYAKQNAEDNYRRQLQFWEMQNSYNSPMNQRMRLEQAGINPNLVYGSGNLQNTADSAPNTAQNKYADSGAIKMQMMQNMMQLGMMQADIELKRSQARAQDAQSGVLGSQQRLNEYTLSYEKSIADLKRLGIATDNDLKRSNTYLNLVSAGDTLRTHSYRIKALEGQIKELSSRAYSQYQAGRLSKKNLELAQQNINNLYQQWRSLKVASDYEWMHGDTPLSVINAPGIMGSGLRWNSAPSFAGMFARSLEKGYRGARSFFNKSDQFLYNQWQKFKPFGKKIGRSFLNTLENYGKNSRYYSNF